MGTIGQTVSGWWSKLTGKTPQETVAPISPALPSGPAIGTAPEPAGYTSAGGRRLKTRSASKKKGGRRHRKTVRKH